MFVRQIIFLVGGKGTRLGTVTATTPKPLLEIGQGVRFLDVLIDEAARHGFTDIILLAGHLGEQVSEIYHGRKVKEAHVRVIIEPLPAGTGGALVYALDILDPWFVVCNGDSLFQINLRDVARIPVGDVKARIALRKIDDSSRYGTVVLEGDEVVGFYEKDLSRQGPSLINAGIYLLSKEVAQSISGACSIEQDIFPELARKRQMQGIELSGYFLDIGLPDTYEKARKEILPRFNRPAVFFDRDGVLNRDAGYTHDPSQLVWMEGAKEAVAMVNNTGWLAIVVTNQAGIARGLYSVEQMHAFHRQMQSELSEIGGHIDAFYFCPFHKDGIVAQYIDDNHPDRKPNPGMILRALTDWNICAQDSILIGDRDHDLEAAASANVPAVKYMSGSLSGLVEPFLKPI